MRKCSLLLLGVVALLLGADAKEEAAKKDMKKMEGTWSMVSGDEDGKKLPEDVVKTAKLVIKGDMHDVTVGKLTFKGTHKVDPLQTPKAIDTMDTEGPFKGQNKKGIYELTDDTFKVCFPLKGDERPKTFDTKAGFLVHTWKRNR